VSVNEGDAEAVDAIWHNGAYADIARLDLAGFTTEAEKRMEHLRALDDYLLEGGAARFVGKGMDRVVGGELLSPPVGFRHYLSVMKNRRPPAGSQRAAVDAWATEVLQAYSHFQVLCATRRGLMGVEGINLRVAERLCKARLIKRTVGWYAGRPVLVTRNDYGLGLMNGDIGITLAVPAETGAAADSDAMLRVAFPAGDGSARIRWILPSRLQAIETVYAMTVHKSQGSEFVHACLVLPEKINPVITRELIYTGITRARYWFSLVQHGNAVIQEGVRRRVMRSSGLGKLLGM
jgi:exodeoxyribonuclease V alpha subunit